MRYGNNYWCELKEDGLTPVKIFQKTIFKNDIEIATAVDSLQAKKIINALEEKTWRESYTSVPCSG